MAVYLVEDKSGKQTLIETRTKAGAINYVTRNIYTATALNTSELVRYIKAGMDVRAADSAEEEGEGEDG